MMPKGAFPHCEQCGSRVQQWTVRICARCRLEGDTKEVRTS